MTVDDLPEFFSRLALLAELFDAKFSEAKQQLYAEALSDLDLADLMRGMQNAARDSKFMPKPVEIRELSVGSDHDLAEDAWLEFKDAMRRNGSYKPYDCDESMQRAINEVFGGWVEACRSELSPEMMQARKKEFMRVWIDHERSVHRRMALPAGTITPKLLKS